MSWSQVQVSGGSERVTATLAVDHGYRQDSPGCFWVFGWYVDHPVPGLIGKSGPTVRTMWRVGLRRDAATLAHTALVFRRSRHQRADILTKVFKVCVKTHEDLYGNPVTLTQQSKKEVFRADERVAQIQSLAKG